MKNVSCTMKSSINIRLHQQSLLLLAFLFLSAVVYRPAMGAPAAVGVVQTIQGQLTVMPGGAGNSAANLDTVLRTGDVVVTAANSKATLLFTDGAQVKLNANTRIVLTPATAVGKGKRSLFKVIRGQVSARLRPGQAAVTNTAIAGVRGTEIGLQVADDDTTTLAVIEGEVDFFNQFGEVIVGKTQQSVARTGAAPTAPITIQNAETIVEWSVDLNRAIIPREQYFFSLDQKAVAAETQRRSALAKSRRTDPSAHLNYADVLYDGRKFDAALLEYREAEKLLPGQAVTQTRIGQTLMELDRLDEAESAFRSATGASQVARVQTAAFEAADSADSNYAPALVGLAWLALTRNRPAEAQVRAREAIAAVELQGRARTVALNDAAPSTAAKESDEAVGARIALGLSYMRQPGHLEEAASTFDLVLKQPATRYSYQAQAWQAMVFLAQGDNAAAVTAARRAATMEPNSGLARGNLALVYFYTGETQQAEREGRLAVKLNPRSVAARVALGQAALAQGDVDAAEREAAQAVALDPQLPQAHYLLGIAEASRRDYTHAARDLENSLELEPNFLPAVSALSRVYNNMGRNEAAVKMLNDILPRHRNTDEVRAALGAVYYDQGKFTDAARQYQAAIERKPRSAQYQAELARTMIDNNRLDAAITAAEAAVRLAPNVGQYHATLGMAYEFSGMSSRAEREYRDALTREPQNALALARLAFLSSGAALQPSQSLFLEPLRRAGGDLRPAEASLTQAFLFSPAIPKQLLKGGLNAELTPQAGDNSERNFNLLHQLEAGDGKFRTLGILGAVRGDGDRANDDARGASAAEYATLVAGPRTNFFFNVLGERNRFGLTGADSTPDGDDRSKFRFGRAQVAMRQRFGPRNFLWLGVFGNTSRNVTTDEGLNSFRDSVTGLPVQRQRFNSNAFLPELRMDFSLGNRPARPSLLSIGLAHADTSFDSRRDLQVPLPGLIGNARFREDDKNLLAYAQLNQRVNNKLSFIGQIRGERLRQENSADIAIPGLAPASTSDRRTRSRLLPSFLANYQVDPRTAVRFSFNRRQTDITTSTFAPNDTLLGMEAGSLPFGTPDDLQLLHLDVQRYLSKRSFVKVFAFHSTADRVDIGGSDLLGFGNGLPAAAAPALTVRDWRARGLGLRFEQQFSRSLFGNASFVARDTHNVTPGPIFNALFSGGDAPYEPKRLASFELHRVDGTGTKVGLRLRHAGSFFQDSPTALGRPRFGSQTYFDLLLAKEPSVNRELFLNVTNLFNRSQIQFNDFGVGRRRISFGVTNRF